MTNDEILQLAREVYDYDFASSAAPAALERLITFANAVRNAALEEAAGIAESAMSDDHKYAIAAAIREARRA